MEIPYSRWYQAIESRRSRRRFEPTFLSREQLVQLDNACSTFRPFSDVRNVLVEQSPHSLFKGAVGPYGKIRGANAFIAFIGNMNNVHVQEQVGYMGEGIILEAEAMNIATCWVALFRPNVVTSLITINKSEQVMAVTPVGYATARESLEERVMTGFGFTHRRKPLSDLVIGFDEKDYPQWILSAVEAARLAPSAMNRQPWRFHIETNSITVAVNSTRREYGVSRRLDCGIAMLHIEVAALNHGIHGKWKFLDSPLVARFEVNK